ncbi:tyrosine-protein phosphatase non-receptor type 12 [Caerostris darwini]|uniref:protein-tyrosine-phosphatase n=1 Tax=Caerostris darwini TaxID=1538125 RepID=A0AAV4SUB4_9ARAC|nr:tyrosine-protein phosphatase non-receptor type 12 [Caerostris darwini]
MIFLNRVVSSLLLPDAVMKKQLKKLTDRLKEDPDYSCSWALKDVNRPKNRYKDIVPYDKSRVILPKCDGIPGSDYINASYVKGASGALAYIAAQGPLPNTVIDFWRMIWVCDVQVVVMACNEKESGKNKCENYWPCKGEIKHYGNISVELIETSQICPDFLVRTLLVKCDSEMRDVYQFHYTSWPDHGIPDTVQPILELVRLMRDCQASETVPIVVHCSAGCGRTGTICAVDFVWACLRQGKLSEDFSLFQIALELRRQRIAMIQTKEQYILAHKAIAALFEQQLNVIDCHIYVNVDGDGEPLMWKELSKSKLTFFKRETLSVNECSSSKDGVASKKTEDRIVVHSEDSEKQLVKEDSSLRKSNISETNSFVSDKLNTKMSISDSLINRNERESSISRNSCLSQHGSEDTIPFIDDDEISIRPNCGRAYLNMPSSGSFSKIINRFDPFVDKIALDTDDSSPDADTNNFPEKVIGLDSSSLRNTNGDENSLNSSNYEINSDVVFPDSYATLPCGSVINKNYGKTNSRESYPPSSRLGRYDDSVSDIVEESDSISKESKKVGKAMVVRRPSISKLKALFEKSILSSNKSSNESGKRSLFRHNSHSVSRAGSAPPSLNCMDKNAAVERESILKLVTRKFRSASVRTEREISSKPYDKSQHRRSTPGAITNFREGFATLSRTVSFNLNRTFRSYSPSKAKIDKSSISEKGSISSVADCSSPVSSKSKLPEIQPKGKSVWYDRSSLPRAVAVVKPTEKVSPISESPHNDIPKSPLVDNNAEKSVFCSVINKPPKLLPFFSTLSKPNERDTSTMWYNEIDDSSSNVEPKNNKSFSDSDVQLAKVSNKPQNSRVLPFIHSITPWKKNVSKSPLSSPESPKNFVEVTPDINTIVSNSTFYTDIESLSERLRIPFKHSNEKPSTCPVPEEIIPIHVPMKNSLVKEEISDKTSKVAKELTEQPKSQESSEKLNNENSSEQEKSLEFIEKTKNKDAVQNKQEPFAQLNTEPVKEILITTKANADVPPAIPKKLGIGKQKQLENQIFFNEHEVLPNFDLNTSDTKNVPVKRKDSATKPVLEGKVESPSLSPKDHYINVNLKTLQNIEQIENTLRSNPRSAIIDLTSRESYCMEEELDNAVKQLSNPLDKGTTSVIKSNSKFPGYEVIWPEENYSKGNISLDLNSKNEFGLRMLKNSKNCKTGLCYSPPLRRSMNANLGLAKCRSCSNIDWLEPEESVSAAVELNFKETTTPTKKLVNEAVVELNTLLDRLTTRTLSENPDFDSNSNQIAKNIAENNAVHNRKWNENENLMTHSVTIVSKTNISDSSSKEEEIVFHFPPPPPLPPPEEDQPSEIFNIVCKNGTIIVADKSRTKESSTDPLCSKDQSSENVCSTDNPIEFPQPTPRKGKQNALKRSASYTNVCVPQSKNKGYENVFLEKYQTLSRLQIDSKCENHEQNQYAKAVSNIKPCRNKPQIIKPKPDYVNVKELHISSSPKLLRKSPKRDVEKECNPITTTNNKCKVNAFKVSDESFNKFHMSKSCPPSEFKPASTFSVHTDDKYSTYGRICKISDKQLLGSEKNQQYVNIQSMIEDYKKKPLPSKKTERAPLPPDTSHCIETKEILPLKVDLPKRLPSRKSEKAPLPPPLLQKSSTGINLTNKNLPNTSCYMNYPHYRIHVADETPVLPAVHENISNNNLPSNAVCANLSKTEMKSKNSPTNHGLSHSQSDASVFLALKQRKMQPMNRGTNAVGDSPKFVNKILKQKKELVSVSSSDSDSSYERIFFDNPTEKLAKITAKQSNREQIVINSPKCYKKELPIAPPRSKRRSTTEVNYAKVKSKEASPSNTSLGTPYQQKLSEKILPIYEPPPAIPLKTKDAFEFPGEFSNKGDDKYLKKGLDNTSCNFKR